MPWQNDTIVPDAALDTAGAGAPSFDVDAETEQPVIKGAANEAAMIHRASRRVMTGILPPPRPLITRYDATQNGTSRATGSAGRLGRRFR